MTQNIETYAPVNTKQEFAHRYILGEFGNASPTWEDVVAFGICRALGAFSPEDRFHLRNKEKGGSTYYGLDIKTLMAMWQYIKDPSRWYCSLMAPMDLAIFQGEVMQADANTGRCGLDLTYTTVAKPMRDALAQEQLYAHGLQAAALLQKYMCPNSLDWLNELLVRYPGHVVEFSVFSKNWGTLPNFNTVFWEVRNY